MEQPRKHSNPSICIISPHPSKCSQKNSKASNLKSRRLEPSEMYKNASVWQILMHPGEHHMQIWGEYEMIIIPDYRFPLIEMASGSYKLSSSTK